MGFPNFFTRIPGPTFPSVGGPSHTMRLRDGLMASWIFWTKAQHWRARWILEPSLRASQLEYLKSIQYFQAMEFPEWMVFFQCVLLISRNLLWKMIHRWFSYYTYGDFFLVATRNYQVNYKWNLETKLTVPVSRIAGDHLYCIVIPPKTRKVNRHWINKNPMSGWWFQPLKMQRFIIVESFWAIRELFRFMFGHGHFACCISLSIIQSSSSHPAPDMSLKFWDSL